MVDVPTPWVSPIAIPPEKKEDTLLRRYEEGQLGCLQESHTQPTIEELTCILDLNGENVFIKLVC
jgi:hypothetical protein